MFKIVKNIGKNTEGSRFAIFILVTFNKLSPNPIITKLPVALIKFKTLSLSIPDKNEAPKVIAPWYKNTEIDENITPIPREVANIIDTIPSIID